jgi:hypothetical protein
VNVIQNVIRCEVSDHNQPIVIENRTGSHFGSPNFDTLPKVVNLENAFGSHRGSKSFYLENALTYKYKLNDTLYMKVTLTVDRCGTKGLARW